MSLIGALNSGKTALAVQQAAIQVTGNNIANAGNADYTRQASRIAPAADYMIRPGVFVGTGVDLNAVERQIDDALEGRIRGSISDNEAAETAQQWIGQIEAAFNELGEDDLSTRLSTFFSSWSNLANKPQDVGLRQIVLQNGDGLAKWLNDLRRQLGGLQKSIDDRLPAVVKDADAAAQQIADLNGKIVVAEAGTGGTANGLRDQRDAVIKRLSQLIDVKTVQQPNGVVNVYVGSEPLVMGTDNRGVGMRIDKVDGELVPAVVFKANNGAMNVRAGQVGGLLTSRERVAGVIDSVDGIAGKLIFELNKIHSSGQGLEGFSSVTSTNIVEDATVALTDPLANLKHVPTHGSFVVHVKEKATGLVTSTLVQVDLDGAGADTSLDSLATSLNGIDGVAAASAGGKLAVNAESAAVEISFSQDSSGALAALGVNAFYAGSDARDIAVNQALLDRPTLLAAAKNGEKGDNQTARAIAALESQPLASLANTSLKESYQATVNGVAVSVAGAKTDSEATRAIMETLTGQREALSGVSLDEEAVNLMRQQRAFQGAARVITAVNEMMDVILSMAR